MSLRLPRLRRGIASMLGKRAEPLPPVATQTAHDAAELDGAATIDERRLADLALERAALGARWLAGVVREDGAFHYGYRPAADSYITDAYNEVRHAGTTYAMYSLHGATGDARVRSAAERATGWIASTSVEVLDAGRALVNTANGVSKLGGQGLALVALLERRRVTANTDRDDLITDMARFLLSMETAEPGSYFMSYHAPDRERLETPLSKYYPGEALLALTRLAQQFPNGPYLDAAVRAADYLVYRRDSDLPALGSVPRDDHWLTMALAELYRLRPDEGYRAVVSLQADRMIAKQYTAANGPAEWIGAARRNGPINYTATATKGEALVAAWAVAAVAKDGDAVTRFANAARRNAQFRMRVQYLPDNSAGFPRPGRLLGGWPASQDNPAIRIDYVQHNISALFGLWSLTTHGDLPIAHPI